MSDFNEWMNKKTPYGNISIRQAYKAGAESRQAEIDELQQSLDSERAEQIKSYSKISDLRLEIDELQKRIELALRLVKNKDCLNYLDKIETTLKGENND